jgi:hypothetical protein
VQALSSFKHFLIGFLKLARNFNCSRNLTRFFNQISKALNESSVEEVPRYSSFPELHKNPNESQQKNFEKLLISCFFAAATLLNAVWRAENVKMFI